LELARATEEVEALEEAIVRVLEHQRKKATRLMYASSLNIAL
jgi:hypothetical protein